MSRGIKLAGVALAAFAVVGVVTVSGRGVFAQDATPTPAATTDQQTTDQTTERNPFLDAFAASLGVTDQATIDAAITDAWTTVIDQQVASGALTQEQGDALKVKIEAGDFPKGPGMFGIGGMTRRGDDGFDHGPRGGDHHRGGYGDDKPHAQGGSGDDNLVPSTPDTEATPAASTGVLT